MRRWRKNVHRPCSSIFFSGGYPHMTDDYKEYQELEKYFQRCTDLAFGNKAMTTFMKAKFNSITEALEKWNNPSKGKEASQRVQGRLSQGDGIGTSQTSDQEQPTNEQTPILNPHVTRTKGRPNEKRYRSCLERGGRKGRGRMASMSARGGGRGLN
ncbi:hypothetical protein C2S51_018622 [Perilla frutescens var. frutescens]|nr:hypothetical protein C2S51_018622 [Perilla frutescens var. frutescens]